MDAAGFGVGSRGRRRRAAGAWPGTVVTVVAVTVRVVMAMVLVGALAGCVSPPRLVLEQAPQPKVPLAPSVTVGPSPVAGRLLVSWSYPAMVPLTSQRLEIVSASPGMARDGETVTLSPSRRSLLVEGLTPDRGYRFRVRGVNSVAQGSPSRWLETAAVSAAPAAAQVSLTVPAVSTADRVVVSWRYPSTSPPLTSQRVEVQTAAGSLGVVQLDASTRSWVWVRPAGVPPSPVRFTLWGVNTVAPGPAVSVSLGAPARPSPEVVSSGDGRRWLRFAPVEDVSVFSVTVAGVERARLPGGEPAYRVSVGAGPVAVTARNPSGEATGRGASPAGGRR